MKEKCSFVANRQTDINRTLNRTQENRQPGHPTDFELSYKYGKINAFCFRSDKNVVLGTKKDRLGFSEGQNQHINRE